MKIGILTTTPNTLLTDTIAEMGHSAMIINPKYCYQYISENDKGIDRLYYGHDGEEPKRITGSTIDAIIPRIGSNVDYSAALLRFINENLGIYCPVNPWGIIYAANKSWTLQRLSNAGIKIPRTIIAESPVHVKWLIDKVGSIPVIIKTNSGSQGKTVAIVDTKRSANSMLEFCLNTNLKVLVEEYIESEASDYRVWVVGDEIAVAMKRSAVNPDDFKANISRGGKGEKVTLSKEDEKLCIKAAHCLGLNIAGVDLLKSKKTGASYIIEVNGNPGTKVIDLTGVNVWKSVVQYIERNYKTSNTGQITASLADGVLLNGAGLLANYIGLEAKNQIITDENQRLKRINENLLLKSK
jgi:ribosomal protein S6--L-glutamate ligase